MKMKIRILKNQRRKKTMSNLIGGGGAEKLCRVCHRELISHSWEQQKQCAEKMPDYYKGDDGEDDKQD